MAGPEWLPSRPSSHVSLPEGQAATESCFYKMHGCFLPAASRCLHVPAASAAAFAGCAVQPQRSLFRPIPAVPEARRGPGCRSSAPEAGGCRGRGRGAGHVPETGLLGGRRGSSIPR